MESIAVGQTPLARHRGRWFGWGVSLLLIGGFVWAGLFLARNGSLVAGAPSAPAGAMDARPDADAALVEPAPAPVVMAEEKTATTVLGDQPLALDATEPNIPVRELFPVLEGLAAQPDDWLVVKEVGPSEDPENPALGGELAVFSLEPLASPCCPLPTSDKAVDAARGLPGVLAAKVNDAGRLLVRYDPAQVVPAAVASAVNRASFLVQAIEANE